MRIHSFHKRIAHHKLVSFLMSNGLLCCLSLSLIDALLVVGMLGKHAMACNLKTGIQEHLMIFWDPFVNESTSN